MAFERIEIVYANETFGKFNISLVKLNRKIYSVTVFATLIFPTDYFTTTKVFVCIRCKLKLNIKKEYYFEDRSPSIRLV